MKGQHAVLVPFAVLAALTGVAARAEAIETGQVVAEATLETVDGGTAPLVDRASGATAIVFFLTQQERSLETLRMLARCQPQLAGKPIRWVGVVPGDTARPEARADVVASGVNLPILVDDGEAVYARLGVRMHPGIAILDRGLSDSLQGLPPPKAKEPEGVVHQARRALTPGRGQQPRAQPEPGGK